MTRAVLDTNVLISALLFPGLPSRLVTAWQEGRLLPVVSPPILDEYLRALAYPKFKLTVEEISGLLEEALLPFIETVHTKGPTSNMLQIPTMRNSSSARWLQTCRGLSVVTRTSWTWAASNPYGLSRYEASSRS